MSTNCKLSYVNFFFFKLPVLKYNTDAQLRSFDTSWDLVVRRLNDDSEVWWTYCLGPVPKSVASRTPGPEWEARTPWAPVTRHSSSIRDTCQRKQILIEKHRRGGYVQFFETQFVKKKPHRFHRGTHNMYFPKGHMTQDSRLYYVKTTSWHRSDVIMTLFLRRVSAGL